MSFFANRHIISYFPGILISILVYLLASLSVNLLPSLGTASFAILIGILLGNTIFKSPTFNHGTKFCESKLLEYSIVLLGSTLSFQTIATLGLKGIIFILIMMSLTIYFSYVVSLKFGFSKNFALLMGAGNAVCGSSAIGASSRVLKSGVSETGLSITMVNVTGTIFMFFLPLFIIPLFFQGQLLENSALLGGILQSVGQVVAGAAMISPETVELAAIFKIFRIIMLTFILILFSSIKSKESTLDKQNSSEVSENSSTKKKLNISIPWYIIGFFILCTLSTYNILPLKLIDYFKTTSKFFEIIALAAIGLRVSFETIKKEGTKSLVLSLLIGFFQTVLGITLIKIIF